MKKIPKLETCFVCGEKNPFGLNCTFTITDKGKVTTKITPHKHYEGYKDIIHGGIIAGLLDEAMGWACASITGRLFFTKRLSVNYIKALPPDIEITVEGEFVNKQGTLAETKGTLKDKDGVVYATAEGEYFILTLGKTKAMLSTFEGNPTPQDLLYEDN